jgi:hypothetical protein
MSNAKLGNMMLTEDRLVEHGADTPMFFNPGPSNTWREIFIFNKTWRYRWDRRKVEILSPEGEQRNVDSWVVLEISEREYREWEHDPFDQPVVMAKDVEDFIKEKIMRTAMARKIGANIK